MTIYGIYAQNGHRAGFWVQHRTWTNMCAQVESIAGREIGALPAIALDGGSDVQVRCFDVRSGRPLPAAECFGDPADRNFLPIAQPAWSHRPLRSWPELNESTSRDKEVAR